MPRPFRLTAPAPLESAVLRQIVDYLRHEQTRERIGPFARLNGGKARLAGGAWISFYRLWLPAADETSVGHSDLFGLYGSRSGHPGRFWALEVKRYGENASAPQTAFLAAVRAAGGIGDVATDFAAARRILFGERA